MIRDITTQCWILALFVRDDGERLLLGTGNYEFKEKQMHFYANKYVNDTVDVQGNDGLMLAGQVRRAATQPFDGYIGGPSYTQQEVEQYRQDFLKFFRKNHYYEVIYIFHDGSAIKRNKGFIVDAPEVKEIRQLSPEYHVSLNFEDVNYYEYQEDEDGNEIYSDSANIPLSTVTSGGLMWDEYGVVWEYSGTGSGTKQTSGTSFTIIDGSEIQTLDKLSGDMSQQTYIGKNKFDTNGTVTTPSAIYEVTDTTVKVTQQSDSQHNATVGIKIPNSSALLGKTINISCNTQSYNGATGGRIILWDSGITTEYITLNSPDADGNMSGSVTLPNSFPAGSTDFVLYLYVNKANSGGNTGSYTIFSDIQIEVGSTKTLYEQYVGGVGVASPNPEFPQTIHVVTGEQTITISNGMGQSKTKTIDLGSIELCKLNGHQDYIYRNNGGWYIHKEVAKEVLDGTETWTSGNADNYIWKTPESTAAVPASQAEVPAAKSSHFTAYPFNDIYNGTKVGIGIPATGQRLCVSTLGGIQATKTFLSNNTPSFYYVLATPTDTPVADDSLIAQLEDLDGLELYSGANNVIVTGDDLAPDIHITYLTAGLGGAVWEAGGGGGISNVQVDSIDMVYPVLTIQGPAQNPVIENLTTNTRIEFSGNVTNSQTLVIDSRNQTSKLNGTSVITSIIGDWPVFAPGINRVSYTAENDTAPDALLEWSEVVG